MEDNKEDIKKSDNNPALQDDRIELLQYERDLILDTYADDVLFVLASGLGLERLVLHHLHLYSDPELLIFVINTTSQDEVYFLSALRTKNPNCPPKIINSDTSIKDRIELYKEGGVQFITSRILMVDILQGRVPMKCVAGIVVYRAHYLLSGFQESFILRLYREKKPDGFVKAFSDNPVAFLGMGTLQRLINKLYVRRARLVPRFDVGVKEALDSCSPFMVELTPDLPQKMRKVQALLVDVIRACVRELKQASTSTPVEGPADDESVQPASGLLPSFLEVQLQGRQFSITEKQQRLLTDLKLLRRLLYQAEELDSLTLRKTLNEIRADKDLLTNNSGWLFTKTAAKLVLEIDNLCKIENENAFTVLEMPKWNALMTTLNELGKKDYEYSAEKEPTIFLIGAGKEVCRELHEIVLFGIKKFRWIKTEKLGEGFMRRGGEPEAEPLWEPSQVILHESNSEEVSDVVSEVKARQREAARRRRKRRHDMQGRTKGGGKQTRLLQFGVVRYKKNAKLDPNKQTPCMSADETPNADEKETLMDDAINRHPLLIIMPSGDRYSFLRYLEALDPPAVVLYHVDLVTLRLLEMFQACNSNRRLCIYVIMYANSNEEERYLCALRKEQLAFEDLVREQGSLMVPREYETGREEPQRIKLSKSTRDAGGRIEEKNEGSLKVVVDLREFNSELPTVLYRRGLDLIPVTLEVGDYILSLDIAVERKALDDLTQSLHSGRVFKQVEQMLRHYKKAVLLIEGNDKDDYRKVNGGPFQGELSRRCRETRSLFAVLIRSYPRINVIWTVDPVHSSEIFEELKIKQSDPDVEKAIAIKSDLEETVRTDEDSEGTASNKKPTSVRLNSVLQRQLRRLPQMASGDVERLMRSNLCGSLLDLINADVEKLSTIVGNNEQASTLHNFFTMDFKLSALTL